MSYLTSPTDHRNQDLPLPNIYFMTVQYQGTTFSTYIAADYSLAAIRKLQRLCVEQHGFRPVRANSDTKMRRLKLGDYLECPEAIPVALGNAVIAHERSTIIALEQRREEVGGLLAHLHSAHVCPTTDYADLEAALSKALQAAEGGDTLTRVA